MAGRRAEQFGYGVETSVALDKECTCQPMQDGLGFSLGLRSRDAHQRAASVNRQRGCERHQALVIYCPPVTSASATLRASCAARANP